MRTSTIAGIGLVSLNVATLIFIVTREPEIIPPAHDSEVENRLEQLTATVSDLRRENDALRRAISRIERERPGDPPSSTSTTRSLKEIPKTLEDKLREVPTADEILPNSGPARIELSEPPGGF